MTAPDATGFDDRAGVRERLALLAYLAQQEFGDFRTVPDWTYNRHSDRWSDGSRGFYVGTMGEASASLAILAALGIDRARALAIVGYPEAR